MRGQALKKKGDVPRFKTTRMRNRGTPPYYYDSAASILLASAGIFEGDRQLLAVTQKFYDNTMPELRRRLLASPVGATFPENNEVEWFSVR
jgi:hypothetical protein